MERVVLLSLVEVISDASRAFGCGAFSRGLGWFQVYWPQDWENTTISAKELVPVMIAAALLGHKLCPPWW